jgi:hypothetical protein
VVSVPGGGANMATCGELLVRPRAAYGVELVFGIPGVRAVELYRGLPATRMRHVTPRLRAVAAATVLMLIEIPRRRVLPQGLSASGPECPWA